MERRGALGEPLLLSRLLLGKLLAYPVALYLKSILMFVNAAVDLRAIIKGASAACLADPSRVRTLAEVS